ncbi:MAG: alpha-amylase family glycosyl hydrolase, partial [Methylomonas sp.]
HDPYFPAWTDTAQVDVFSRAGREQSLQVVLDIADQCDGLRCDMAMLVLPEIFQRTWGITAEAFWPKAIQRIRQKHPGFVFMAEVYWDLEWTLQQQGFDYTYDKRLYDRLRDRHARAVREHFWADLDYQNKSARFLENHDEPRAASTFPQGVHEAAAVLTYFCPGLRFFHQGQLQGWTKKISVHLSRGPQQPVDPGLQIFYRKLLEALRLSVFHDGDWKLLACTPAWENNWTSECIIAFIWERQNAKRAVVAVNFAPNQSQCYLPLPGSLADACVYTLKNLMGSESYDRSGDSLVSPGLYLDMAPWGYAVFELASKT